jgi:hypothetical protein
VSPNTDQRDAATVIKQLTKVVAAIPSPGLRKLVHNLSHLLDVSIVDKKNGHQRELEALVLEINRATLRLEDCSDRLRKDTASKSDHWSETEARKHDELREGEGVQGQLEKLMQERDTCLRTRRKTDECEPDLESKLVKAMLEKAGAFTDWSDKEARRFYETLSRIPGFFKQQTHSKEASEPVPENVKVICENLNHVLAIAKSNQAPEHVPEQESISRDAQRALMVEVEQAALFKGPDPDVLLELLVIAIEEDEEKIKGLERELSRARGALESLRWLT